MDTRTATDSCRSGLKADNRTDICSSINIELVLKSWKGEIEKILKSCKEKKKKRFVEPRPTVVVAVKNAQDVAGTGPKGPNCN